MILKNLRASREDLDLKQKDIADFFDLHFTTISGWETGKDTIPIERLIDYANEYSLSLDYLFGIISISDKFHILFAIKTIKFLSSWLNLFQNRSFTQNLSGLIFLTQYSLWSEILFILPIQRFESLSKYDQQSLSK